MGAWGELAFDNDTANDWGYDLADARDLNLAESTFGELEAVGSGYLDQDVACYALAACEVVARLQGHRGYTNATPRTWIVGSPSIRWPSRMCLSDGPRPLSIGSWRTTKNCGSCGRNKTRLLGLCR